MAALPDQKAAAAAADQKLEAAVAELKAAVAEQKAAAAEEKTAAAELKAAAAELKAAAAKLKAAAEVAVDPDLKEEAEAADQKAAVLENKMAALEKKAASMEQEVAAAEQKAVAAEQKAAAAELQVKAAAAAAVGEDQEIMLEEDKKELHNLLSANLLCRTPNAPTDKSLTRTNREVIFIVLAVFAWILIGTISIHYLEDTGYEEALYLSITSMTIVGYWKTMFKTWQGILLSSIVLLFATLALAKSFGFLADVKNRGIQQSLSFEQSKLDRYWTLDDMLGADNSDNN